MWHLLWSPQAAAPLYCPASQPEDDKPRGTTNVPQMETRAREEAGCRYKRIGEGEGEGKGEKGPGRQGESSGRVDSGRHASDSWV